jgi:hypothetical protein
MKTAALIAVLTAAPMFLGAARAQMVACNQGGSLREVAGQSCTALPYKTTPQWAVDKQRDQNPQFSPSIDDPIWQHAVCDEQTRTITWCFP